MKAVLDVMLLGKCDVLYLTTRSGFSKIGLYYAEENTPFRLLFSVCHKHAFCAIWRNCLILCLEWMTIISNSKMRCALSRPSMLRTSWSGFQSTLAPRLSDNSFKILIPNDAGRSDLELIIHYRNTYPSLIYPLFDVYAEWLSDSQIDSIKDSLVGGFGKVDQ